jgi:undecaprenyl-diphosphatase
MLWYQAVILGAVQGITEFWPISSSAHLSLLIWLTGWGDPQLSFTVALHAGTLLAVIIYFRHTVSRLLAAAWRMVKERKVGEDRDSRMVVYLLIATLPALLIGVFANDAADMMESMPLLIILVMLGFSLFLWWVDRSPDLTRDAQQFGYSGSLVVGIFQVFAMIPGVSRSGSTISAGLLEGLKREEAVEFAFLLSIPTVGAAFAFSCLKLASQGTSGSFLSNALLGAVASTLTGLFAIRFLLRWVRKGDFTPFVIYRVALSVVLLFVYFAR